MALVQKQEWQSFLQNHPDAHLLQTAEWGEFKGENGWYPQHIINGNVGAQILFKTLPLGFTIAYVPKGPVGTNWEKLVPELIQVCRSQKALLIYIEPDNWENEFDSVKLSKVGFTPSTVAIQPRRTIVIDLDGESEEWLKRMNQTTRRYIRKAKKEAVEVSISDDVDSFSALMRETGTRNEFGIHQPAYYKKAHDLFVKQDECALLLASFGRQHLAGLMVFKRGARAWYFYGASGDRQRGKVPAYLLQWEAMNWAAQNGCKHYDLWGIPDQDVEVLETQFTSRSDDLWGVYRFKRGFGGSVRRTAGVYQLVLNKPLYGVYEIAMRLRRSGIV